MTGWLLDALAGAFQNLLNIFPENGTNQRNLKSPFASLWLTSKQRQDHIDLPQVANGVKLNQTGIVYRTNYLQNYRNNNMLAKNP